MRLHFAMVLIGLGVLLLGCAPRGGTEPASLVFPQGGQADEAVVGAWTSDGGNTVLDFKEDGSFTLEVDMTVDMAQGGGIQRIQRSDAGRWTVHEGSLYLEHGGGLVLAYELVEEDKPDEVHLRVHGQRNPIVYQRHIEEAEGEGGEQPAPGAPPAADSIP